MGATFALIPLFNESVLVLGRNIPATSFTSSTNGPTPFAPPTPKFVEFVLE